MGVVPSGYRVIRSKAKIQPGGGRYVQFLPGKPGDEGADLGVGEHQQVTAHLYEVADENGKTFGFARSIWAAIDVETRRPTLLDIEALGKYIDERPCPIEKPGKIMPAENKAEGIPYSIKYSDLDINGHFNSVKYIEHLLDLFDIDQFKTREIGRLEIAYQSEGKQGMPLTLHKAESAPDKQDMAICHEGKAICRAAVTWR